MNICELNPKKPEWKKYIEVDIYRDGRLLYKASPMKDRWRKARLKKLWLDKIDLILKKMTDEKIKE